MPEQPDYIQGEIRRLKADMEVLRGRLERLEQIASAVAGKIEDQAELSEKTVEEKCPRCGAPLLRGGTFCMVCGFKTGMAIAEEPVYEEAPAEVAYEGQSAAVPKTVAEAAPHSETKPERFARREAEIGMKWFGLAGIVLVVAAFAFFVKYAIDNQWIGPTTRIVGGVVIGVALILLGSWFNGRERYRGYGRILIGGGFALMYFTLYAAYYFYSSFIGISREVDLALLTVVVAAGIMFSTKLDSSILAGEAFLMGYVTAYLCGSITVFTLLYNVILAAGLVYMVYQKGWFKLAIAGIAATYAIHISWLTANSGLFAANLFFLTCYFALFVALGFVERSFLSRVPAGGDRTVKQELPRESRFLVYVITALSFLIPIAQGPIKNVFVIYFMALNVAIFAMAYEYSLGGLGIGITGVNYFAFYLWDDASRGPTVYALAFLGCLFVLFTLYSFMLQKFNRKVPYEEVFISLLNTFGFFAFLFYKIYSEYHDYAGMFTLGMAVVALGLCAVASWRKFAALFQVYLVLAVVFATLVIPVQLTKNWLPMSWAVEAAVLIYMSYALKNVTLRILGNVVAVVALAGIFFYLSIPELRYASLGATTASFFFIAYQHHRNSNPEKRKASMNIEACMYSLVASYMGSWIVWQLLENAVWKFTGLCAWAAVLLLAGLLLRVLWLRVGAWAVCALIIGLSIVAPGLLSEYDLPLKVLLPQVITYFLCLAGCLLLGGGEDSDGNRIAGYSYGAAAVVVLTVLLGFQFKGHWLSIVWGIEAVAILVAGVASKARFIRYAGILLLLLTLVKVLALDMKELETGFRVISLFGVGVVLLVASFLYYRYRDVIEKIL